MKDFIVSKSFNSSVSYTENMSRAILNFEKVYNPCSFGFDYCEQLFPRIKQKYNLVKAIGEKENYTEKEAKAINNFFTFAVASNVFALDGKLKYKYFITNAINHTSTSTVDYYVGTADFYVPAHIQCYCSKTNQKNFAVSITVEAKPLNNEQMKKFIKLLNDYTFETFSIGFCQEREAS